MTSPSILIAVKSCAADVSAGHNQTIRETWGQMVRRHGAAGPLFFVGAGTMPLQDDEVRVDAPDGYYGLPQKTCAILRWMGPTYSFVYLCDTDTFVRPELLMHSGFQQFDLTGLFFPRVPGQRGADGYYAWPSGGGGYWLSAKAAAIIAAHTEHSDWAEDRMVGQLLGPHIASGALKAAARRDYGAPDNTPNLVTAHFCARGMQRDYDPKWMRKLYGKFYQGRQ